MLDFEAEKHLMRIRHKHSLAELAGSFRMGISHSNRMEACLLQSWARTCRQCKRITKQIRCCLGEFYFLSAIGKGLIWILGYVD